MKSFNLNSDFDRQMAMQNMAGDSELCQAKTQKLVE